MTKEAIEKLPEVMQSMTATLKRCSKDDASSDYMTESRLLAVNFDRFSKYYCQVVKIAQQPKTNDALYCTEDGKWYFFQENGVALKNGWKVIDGEEYYFLKSGVLAVDALVPGGYRVDASGRKIIH